MASLRSDSVFVPLITTVMMIEIHVNYCVKEPFHYDLSLDLNKCASIIASGYRYAS